MTNILYYRKKFSRIYLLLLIAVSAITICSCKNLFQPGIAYKQKLWVDVTDVDSAEIQCVEDPVILKEKQSSLENDFSTDRNSFNYRNHLKVIFRYRDTAMLSVFKTMCTDQTLPLIHRIRAIAVIGEIGGADCETLLKPFCHDTNDVVREYVVNTLGKIGSTDGINFLQKLKKNEHNGYVIATINAAINRINKSSPAPLNRPFILDTNGLDKVAFLFNPEIIGNEATVEKQEIEGSVIQNKMKCALLLPHQQYKMNPQTVYNRHSYGVNFGTDQSPLIHVGEDSGHCLDGLPIHSIADGVITHILYEQSWGVLVAIESNLSVHGTVTFFYGHLSHCIDVRIGQKVVAGDKIGELGPQESVVNADIRRTFTWV